MVGELRHILCGSSRQIAIYQIDRVATSYLTFVSFINVFTRLRKAEADPVSKLRAGDFSNICWSSLITASLR